MKARIAGRIIEVNKPGLETPQSGTARRVTGYRSKLESRYAEFLMKEQLSGEITEWHYEPMVLKLSDTARYRPDFLKVYRNENKSVFIEVKGRWIKNRRDGITRLKWAAQKYWWWEFRLAEWVDGGWKETVL